jgi:paraquat-inducible protein B
MGNKINKNKVNIDLTETINKPETIVLPFSDEKIDEIKIQIKEDNNRLVSDRKEESTQTDKDTINELKESIQVLETKLQTMIEILLEIKEVKQRKANTITIKEKAKTKKQVITDEPKEEPIVEPKEEPIEEPIVEPKDEPIKIINELPSQTKKTKRKYTKKSKKN